MSDVDVGLVAGALTTAAWLPQLLRTWQRRSARDISWTYLTVFGLGVALWITYGALRDDLALILANAVTIVLVVGLMLLKVLTSPRSSHHLVQPIDIVKEQESCSDDHEDAHH